MPRQPRISPLAAVVASLVIIVTAVASTLAQSDLPGRPVAVKDTGMFGLTMGRVARIDAVNLGLGDNPGDVHLEFFDAAGNMLADKTVMLGPGESSSLDFMLPVATTAQTGRADIRARASILDNS